MAALKLITPSEKHSLRISASNIATRYHCPPDSQAEMAALKLITLNDKHPLSISYDNGATRGQ
eukprot:9238657-Karenia_brevis.AAC.1